MKKNNNYNNDIHFRLNEKEMQKLIEIMKSTNYSKSKVMRMLINSFYDKCILNKEVEK